MKQKVSKNQRIFNSQSIGGQSTIEFLLTLVFLLGFVFFYLQLAMVLSFGNFVHYATFMSARAYLSAGEDPSDQYQRAEFVLKQMLKAKNDPGKDRWPSVGRGEGPNRGILIGQHPKFQPQVRAFSWLEGSRYVFKSKLLIGLIGSQEGNEGGEIKLTSESWLLREPTVLECKQEMDRFKSLGTKSIQAEGLIDNGC